MDKDDALVQANKSKTLLVRHLPSDLSREEKEDLLKFFGASSVRVFSAKGPLKHAAYATFGSEKSAAKALNRLHQLQILSHTLVVEFAKGQDHITALKDPPVSGSATGDNEEKKKKKKQPSIPLIEIGVAPSLGLKFQTSPSLKYLYPPPSNAILANIMHALLSVPKLYVQVLHLMNKMNLPCPFGPVTPRPVAELAQDGAEGLDRDTTGGIEEEEEAEGFGKLYPSGPAAQEQEQDSQDEEDLPSHLISRRELEKGRLSRDEIKRMSVFKNYEPGEPTCRLYVKNIAKQVEEKDLKYIYGRYIDPSSEAERNMFDIVLMKEGRMKGQAFVGLPSERCAEKALRDTNGYILHDKPLVVQFARSAKPKADVPDPKKGSRPR